MVTQTEPAGPDLVVFATASQAVELCCRTEGGVRVDPGDRVGLVLVPEHLHFFDPVTGNAGLALSARERRRRRRGTRLRYQARRGKEPPESMKETKFPGHGAVRLAGALLWGALVAGPAFAQTTVTMWTLPRSEQDFAARGRPEADDRGLRGGQSEASRSRSSRRTSRRCRRSSSWAIAPAAIRIIVWIDAKNLGGLSRSRAPAPISTPLVAKAWPQADRDDYFVKAGWNAGVTGRQARTRCRSSMARSVIYYRKDLFAGRHRSGDADDLGRTARSREEAHRRRQRRPRRRLGLRHAAFAAQDREHADLIGLLDKPDALYNGCKAHFATEPASRG